MTLQKLATALNRTGYPVRHLEFNKPTRPPFVVYLTPARSNISADSKTARRVQQFRVELYTASKDTAAEAKVEAVLESLNTGYTVSEEKIDGESLYVCYYEFESDLEV